jgi:hypothetical protein
MPMAEVDGLLQQIRALVLELRRLEGDGVDGIALTARRRKLELLKSRLADLVSHEPARLVSRERSRTRRPKAQATRAARARA